MDCRGAERKGKCGQLYQSTLSVDHWGSFSLEGSIISSVGGYDHARADKNTQVFFANLGFEIN